MAEYTVAISSDFFTAFAKLPKQKQGRVMEFMSKFRNNPMLPGFNYEKINDAHDANMRSVRVDDTYRAIVMREDGSNVFLLLWVDHHDAAYDWACRKRCMLNHTTGSIQVYETIDASAAAPDKTIDKPLFPDITDAQLASLGVPQEQYGVVRALSTVDDFKHAQQKLPRDAYEALDLVRDGCDIDEVIDILYADSIGVHAHDIGEALATPISQMQFTVVEGEEELKAMMNAPLEKWRVFLHPSQRRLVNKQFSGSARVLGGAGTGKTVVAMHRAKYLAEHCANSERVLFTTFTANLAQDIKENLKKICSPEEMRNIEVIHLDAWVARFLNMQEYEYRIEYGDKISELWAEAVRVTGEEFDLPDGFFEDEWINVVQAQGINTLAEYVQASRAGRGVRLDRKKRILVWKVFDEYRTLMNVNRVRDSAAAMNECCHILARKPDFHPYRSIIVDEAQDFGMGAFRLLKALSGEDHANDLFIVGDAHQRIYKNKVTLSKCLISVRGRSSQLRMNYRTTEEIRAWAMRVLKGISFDDLDGGEDDGKGYRSLSHGDAPKILAFDTYADEAEALVNSINENIASGIEPKDICVVARTQKHLDDYKVRMEQAGIRVFEIKRSKTDDRHMPGVRLATMHRVKGLEFTCVYIMGMNKNIMPLKYAISTTDPVAKAEAITAERCLFYVALTRARKLAYISGYGQLSEFIS